MTLYDFTAMNEEQQAEILWERGVYLMVRQEREHKFALQKHYCKYFDYLV